MFPNQNPYGPQGWHPYYGWGWGQQGYNPNPAGLRQIGDPNLRPPGNWFGHSVVGSGRSWLRSARVAGKPLVMMVGDAGDARGVPNLPPPAPEVAMTGMGAAVFGALGIGLGYLVTRSPMGALVGGAIGIAGPYVLEAVSG